MQSSQDGSKKYYPKAKLLFLISFVSFSLLTVLLVFSGQQPSLAFDQNKLLVTQQAKIEVMQIEMQTSYLKTRTIYGQIESVQASALGFELSGTLQKLQVKEGHDVERGDILASLDIQRLQARQQELNSSLRNAKANAKLAQLSAKRVQELVSKNLEPQQRLDEAQAQLEAAQASMSEVQARLDSLQVELSKARLVAPFDGQIVQQYVDEGTVLMAGQAVFKILQNGMLEARFGLPETTGFSLQRGQEYPILINDSQIQAQLVALAKERDLATRTLDSLFSINSQDLNQQQKDSIVAGDLVALNLQTTVQKAGAWVPLEAMASGVRGMWTIYVLNQAQEVEARMVSIEYSQNNRVYIVGAIQQGDKIIVSGIHRIAPKQRLTQVAEVKNRYSGLE